MDGNQKVWESVASQFHYEGKKAWGLEEKSSSVSYFQETFIQEHPLLPKEDE